MNPLLTLIAPLALLWATAAAGTKTCDGGLTVDVITTRNSTGHRHIKADLNVRGKKIEEGAVGFHVEQSSFMVDDIRQLHLTATISAPEPRTAPPGYVLAPGLGWYRLYLTPRTWEEARLACEAEGAHLAVLNSPEEAEALKGIFARAPATIPNASWSSLALVGYSDVVEGNHTTIFGETLEQAGYTEWAPGQPNNGKSNTDPDSDCVGIQRDGKLNDLQCREKGAYFCEYHL